MDKTSGFHCDPPKINVNIWQPIKHLLNFFGLYWTFSWLTINLFWLFMGAFVAEIADFLWKVCICRSE